MVPIKISSKLDGLVMKVGGKVKWQKVGFKFKKLRQGETVPLWDEPLPRARPDFPQRNTLFSFKMKLNIWKLLKDITRFPLFHPCHHVSSIFTSYNNLSGSGTRFPRRTQCPRRPSPSYFYINHFHFFSSNITFTFKWFRDEVSKEDSMPEETLTLLFSHIDPLYELHASFLKVVLLSLSFPLPSQLPLLLPHILCHYHRHRHCHWHCYHRCHCYCHIVIAIANSLYEYQATFLSLGNLSGLLLLK